MRNLILFLLFFEAAAPPVFTQNLIEIRTKTDSLYEAGKYKLALEWAEKGEKMARETPDLPDSTLASMIFRLANCQVRQNKNAEAEANYRETLKIRTARFGPASSEVATSLHGLGNAVMQLSRLTEAQQIFKKSLALRDSLGQPPSRNSAASLNSLGIIAANLGNSNEAEFYFQKAADHFKTRFGEQSKEYATAISNLAQNQTTLGNYDRAVVLVRQALAIRGSILGKKHSVYASSLDALANLYQTTGHFEESENPLREAISIREKNLGADNRLTLRVWASLAKTFSETNRLDSAETVLNAILPKMKAAVGPDDDEIGGLLTDLGIVLMKKNDLAGAVAAFDTALVLEKKIMVDARISYLSTLQKLAQACGLLGQNQRAAQLYSEAQVIENQLLTLLFPHFSDRERQLYFQPVAEEVERFASFVWDAEPQLPQLVGQLFDLRLATRGVLFSASQKMRTQFSQSGNLADFDAWLETRERLAMAYLEPPDKPSEPGQSLGELAEKARFLEKKLSAASQQFFQQTDTTVIRWSQIRDALGSDEAAVEIIRFQKQRAVPTDSIFYAALVVSRETTEQPILVRFSDGRELETVIFELYQNEMSRSDPPPVGRTTPSFRSFWQPLAPFLRGKKRVFFALDGVFHKLNLGTLRGPDGQFLMETIDFHRMTSLTDLVKKGQKKRGSFPKTALLVGNPTFDFSQNQRLDRSTTISKKEGSDFENTLANLRSLSLRSLGGAEREVDEIGSLFIENGWKSSVFTQKRALESVVKSADSVGVVHLATHGFFLEDLSKRTFFDTTFAPRNPLLRSMLFFSGATNTIFNQPNAALTDGQDGILTALEVQNMQLDGTELVTLSACQTGLGDVVNGEGVFGLQRAFRVAGARSLLMSLWNVDDAATQLLMRHFYENWLGGLPKNEALREAERTVRACFPQPSKWGGFVLVGD